MTALQCGNSWYDLYSGQERQVRLVRVLVGRMRISVAIKLVIFFGLAITVVVAAALSVPWLWISTLSDELAIQSARNTATAAAARCGLPATEDWEDKQLQLSKWWEQFARQTQLPPTEAPRLIKVDPFSKDLPGELDESLSRAIIRTSSAIGCTLDASRNPWCTS